MWKSDATQHLVTTNAFIKNDGSLVMGAGAALQAIRLYPTIAIDFGLQILSTCGSGGRYGLILSYQFPVGAFQVKYNWWEKADLKLIAYSVKALKDWNQPRRHKVAMNFPGIGNGRLRRDQVIPILSDLPDNIEVWER